MNKALVHVPDDVLYRYENHEYSNGLDQFDDPLPGSTTRVHLHTYRVLSRTRCGAWITCWNDRDDRRFVRLTARKQFASNTKNEALDCFKHRKKAQVRILKSQLANAERALRMAENGLDELKALFYG